MRLINTLFIICLFGKLINCNNNNDQTKSNDNLVQSASNQQQTTSQIGPESRQMNHGGYHESSSKNINIYANELSPKQSAYHNSHPGAPIGYIKIQPLLASPFASSHQPEEPGSTSFLRIIKPEKLSKKSLLTNKLKSFMSSLLSWKDNSNTPYMTSGSFNSYSALQPPFNFQPPPSQQSSNYAASSNLASVSSPYKPIVFPNNNYQPNSNGYKYSNTFNPTHLNGNNQQSNNQQPQYYYNQASASNQFNNQVSASNQFNNYALNSLNNLNNPSQTFAAHQNRNNLNSNSNHNNYNSFPPNSFQVASGSNVNSIYTSSSNQYQPSSNQNNQPESNNNQRSETVDSLNDSSSSSNQYQASDNPGNSPLTNPVSNS